MFDDPVAWILFTLRLDLRIKIWTDESFSLLWLLKFWTCLNFHLGCLLFEGDAMYVDCWNLKQQDAM